MLVLRRNENRNITFMNTSVLLYITFNVYSKKKTQIKECFKELFTLGLRVVIFCRFTCNLLKRVFKILNVFNLFCIWHKLWKSNKYINRLKHRRLQSKIIITRNERNYYFLYIWRLNNAAIYMSFFLRSPGVLLNDMRQDFLIH